MIEEGEFVFYRNRLVEIVQWDHEDICDRDWWWVRDLETEEETLVCVDELSEPINEMEVIAWTIQ